MESNQEIVQYTETPLEDKLIDYAGRWWPSDAMVWVRRRVLKDPPESFSLVVPNYKDERLITNWQALNDRY